MDAEGLALLDPLADAAGLPDFASGLADEVARAAALARDGVDDGVGVPGAVVGEADEAESAAGELDRPPAAAGDATGALTAGAETTGAAE